MFFRNLETSFHGVKFDDLGGGMGHASIQVMRDPIPGLFYAKGGSNRGKGGDFGSALNAEGHFLPRPNGEPTPIPDGGPTAVALGIALLVIVGIRRALAS